MAYRFHDQDTDARDNEVIRQFNKCGGAKDAQITFRSLHDNYTAMLATVVQDGRKYRAFIRVQDSLPPSYTGYELAHRLRVRLERAGITTKAG